ncbi:hypothetical protein [Planctomycetes bacterium CA13]|uniref:hypothetical protein n=1 Tax=Novipirellula herctigrandis TaxID=2527986 RepID=UPI0011B7FD8A
MPAKPSPRLRITIGKLFLYITVSAMVFAILRAAGFDGLFFTLFVSASFIPLAKLIRSFHQNPIW